MASTAAKLFCSYMESKGNVCQIVDEEECVVRTGWKLATTRITVYVHFDPNDTNVHLEGMEFVQIPADKTEKMYKVVNDFNLKYRWTKFVVDEELGQIVVKDDGVIQLDSAADEAYELMMRMISIVEEVHPAIMKELWA